MSLTPPPPERSTVGDAWVDPITADRWEFTGDESRGTYGWVNVGPNAVPVGRKEYQVGDPYP